MIKVRMIRSKYEVRTMKSVLLGCGTVGKGVLEIMDAHPEYGRIAKVLVRDLKKHGDDPRMTDDPEEVFGTENLELVIECMGGLEPAHTYVKRALEAGCHVVTSNKKMLAAYYEELQDLAEKNGCLIRYEACVGGGIPWIHELIRLQRIDEVTAFRGIINGTTNYILSGMTDDNTSFEEALSGAQEAGYAEADPTDDIDGYDARFKVALSAAAGFGVLPAPEEIPCFGIRHISAGDIVWAKEKGRTIKLIGSGKLFDDHAELSVLPVMLKNSSLLAGVTSNLNGLSAVSTTLGTSFYIGQGAGRYPTAHAVVQDIIGIGEGERVTEHCYSMPVDNSALSGCWYVRTIRPEVFHDAAEIIDGETVVTREMPFQALQELLAQCNDPDLFLALIEA